MLVENDESFQFNIDQLGFVPDVYSPKQQAVDEALLAACKKNNLFLIPWTVNEIEQMIRFKNLGVAGLITDFPDVAVKLLR